MLLGNFLKVLNCAVRTFNPHSSIRQLSGVCVNELKNVNLHSDLNVLGKEVEFYRLTPVSREAINDYKPSNMAFITESYPYIGKYSVSSLYKKAFKEVESNLPILKTLKSKWHNRARTEVEGFLGKVMADFMPYFDLTMIIFFPKWIQASYFMFMRPVAVYSGLGTASTIKMINDKMVMVGPESDGILYVLVKISQEEAVDLPIHEVAIKIKHKM